MLTKIFGFARHGRGSVSHRYNTVTRDKHATLLCNKCLIYVKISTCKLSYVQVAGFEVRQFLLHLVRSQNLATFNAKVSKYNIRDISDKWHTSTGGHSSYFAAAKDRL